MYIIQITFRNNRKTYAQSRGDNYDTDPSKAMEYDSITDAISVGRNIWAADHRIKLVKIINNKYLQTITRLPI